MFLYTSPCYNPFHIEINGKEYTLDSISVFENGKVIARCPRGWFGSNNNFRQGLELACDCVKKIKVDLNCKTAFIVCGDCTWEKQYALYIPNSVIQLQDPTYQKEWGVYVKETRRSAVYDGVFFDTLKDCCNQYYNAIREVNEIGKALSIFHSSSDISKLDDCLAYLSVQKDALTRLKAEYDSKDAKTLWEENSNDQ